MMKVSIISKTNLDCKIYETKYKPNSYIYFKHKKKQQQQQNILKQISLLI